MSVSEFWSLSAATEANKCCQYGTMAVPAENETRNSGKHFGEMQHTIEKAINHLDVFYVVVIFVIRNTTFL